MLRLPRDRCHPLGLDRSVWMCPLVCTTFPPFTSHLTSLLSQLHQNFYFWTQQICIIKIPDTVAVCEVKAVSRCLRLCSALEIGASAEFFL